MQICDVLVAVIVVVAFDLYLSNDDVDGSKNSTNPHISELKQQRRHGNENFTWK